jgi:hypothetical protein
MKYPSLINLLDNIDFRVQTQKLFDPEFVDHGEKIGVHFVRGHVFAHFDSEALRVHGKVGMFVHAEEVVGFEAGEGAVGSPWAADGGGGIEDEDAGVRVEAVVGGGAG